jgi:hypothetical protein
MLLCARAFALQIGQNHGLLNFALLRTLNSTASGKIANAPAAARATIVLPNFVRSLSAEKKYNSIFHFGSLFPPKAKIGMTSAAMSG